jgi:tetratricopeptide (TPR) repeat protein
LSDPITCEDVAERALIERYVAGRLDRADAGALEEHYLFCARCRDDVRLAVAVRGALPSVQAGPLRTPRRFVRFGIAAALAAAAIAAVLLAGPRRSGSAFVPLGAVREPPIYLGIQVRATPHEADSLFAAAMSAYATGRYEDASAGLGAALAAGVDSAPAEFFRAASLLMRDRARDAAAAFRRVIALGDTPYLVEARFYLAKALLRLGRGVEATEALRLAATDPGEVGRQARALADSVEVMRRR